jgi:signal transduction histidine kinase
METAGTKKVVLFSTLTGAAAGYLLLHPYTMLVYGLYGRHDGMAVPSDAWGIIREAVHSFRPEMLHMGLPFALIGAVAGLFFGFWLVARRRKEEAEIRASAVDTLHELMVTLSHYLLNASTVIGGYAAHVLKTEDDEEKRRHILVIREEAEYIEAVVKSLQSLESVVTENYTRDSETMIIDIQHQLDKRIKESVGKRAAVAGRKAA